LNDLAPDKIKERSVVVENAGPVSVTLRCESGVGLKHITRITLFRNSDRVDIRNEITQNFADVRHWTFSFNLKSPDVHTEEVGAVIHVKTRKEGGDYADSHARYDYATLNHFADITDGENRRGVTLANADCSFVRLGHSTVSKLDTATPQLHVLAGGQVDGPRLGIRGQNGATHFLQRFALRPHGPYDPVAAMTFALEHQNPLIAGTVTGGKNGPYPTARYSLLSIPNPSTLLWALKPHEDGVQHGIIARVWNLSNQASDCALSLAPGLASANRTTHIETDLAPLPITQNKVVIPLTRFQLQTVRLSPAR
jgi:alpha-mannosidase